MDHWALSSVVTSAAAFDTAAADGANENNQLIVCSSAASGLGTPALEVEAME